MRHPFASALSFPVLFPFYLFFFYFFLLLLTFLPHDCAVKRRPKLKSRYKSRVKVAIEYAKMIDDLDDLVDPRTLARHCLGPEPSAYILHAMKIEEKSKCFLGSLLS